MDDGTEREVVRTELVIAWCGVVQFLLLSTTAITRPDGWALALGTAVVSGGFVVAADRSRLGRRLLLVVGAIAIATIFANLFVEFLPIGLLPWAVIGFSAAFGLNRAVFGLPRPVPPLRLETQRSGLSDL